MPSIGELVARHLDSYAGADGYTFMETYGPNSGPKINEWHRVWGWTCCQPYCGITEAGVAREVKGGWDAYGGSNFLSPSVAQIEANGRRLGWQWAGGRIPTGAIATYGGSVHTNIVLLDHGPIAGQFTAVGGNESNGIRRSERSSYSCRLWVPPGISKGATPPRPTVTPAYDFGLEDPRAKQFVLKTFLTQASRDKRLKAMLRPGDPYRKFHPRPHRRGSGKGTRYLIIGGPLRYYGPYDTKEQRAQARRLLVPRLRTQHKLGSANVTVLRDFRVPEKLYKEQLAQLKEWIARYG